MKYQTKAKKIISVLIAFCFMLTAFPATVSAASFKKPTQVKIVSVKASKANSYNKAKVAVKWKKVKKNTTGYQVYQRIGNGKWKLVKTIKKNKVSASITVKGGKKYHYKVRAINKRKIGNKYKTRYGKFSKVKSVSIKKSAAIPDEGSYEVDFINIETDYKLKTLSCIFEYTNLDNYDKNPSNYMIARAIQDGKTLNMISGTISKTAPGLKKVKWPLKIRINSDNPILLQLVDKSDTDVTLEYVLTVD